MSARWPRRDEPRNQRRAAAAEKYAADRVKADADDKEQNWQRESLLKGVRSLSDTDETVAVIAEALIYLLERSRD